MALRDVPARLLIVEDQRELRFLFKHLLKTSFDLEIVASYDEAIDRASQQGYDAFILDINLGEERNGIDLLQALRAMPAHRETPALACTAYAMYGDRDRFLEAGFHDYLPKPFTREDLVQRVNVILAVVSARAAA